MKVDLEGISNSVVSTLIAQGFNNDCHESNVLGIVSDEVENELKSDSDTISIIWSVEDILYSARQNRYLLTREEAREILKEIKASHNANIGVNWEVIKEFVYNKGKEVTLSMVVKMAEPITEEEARNLDFGSYLIASGDKVMAVEPYRQTARVCNEGLEVNLEVFIDNDLLEDYSEEYEDAVEEENILEINVLNVKAKTLEPDYIGESKAFILKVKGGLTAIIEIE